MTFATRSALQCECGDHVFVALTKGYTTMVSPQDAQILTDLWFATVTPRAVRVARRVGGRSARRILVLAREIMKPSRGQYVDHVNCDPLDNRRPNLRLCTPAQNALNRRKESGAAIPFKGVYLSRGRYQARITLNGKRVYLGEHATAELAAKAYAKAARELHGEFARSE